VRLCLWLIQAATRGDARETVERKTVTSLSTHHKSKDEEKEKMAHATSFDTERLSEEQIEEANKRLEKLQPAHQPAAPAAEPPAGVTKERKSNRPAGTKGVLLQLNPDQYAALEAAAKAERRTVANYIAICVEDNFTSFITLK
jgi:hypothetical protein